MLQWTMGLAASAAVAAVAAILTSNPGEGDARVATLTRSGLISVGCMRSTSGVCHVLVKSPKGMERLEVKSGTVGRLTYVGPPTRIAVGARSPDPALCVFHDIVEGEQTVGGS